MKRLRFTSVAVLALMLAVTSCKKEKATNPLLACRQSNGGIGAVTSRTIMFWTDQNFGCGAIRLVSIRNTETNSTDSNSPASITRYFATQPACGTTGTATLDVLKGYEYEYTLSCTGRQWQAKVTVDCSSDDCIPIQLK